MVGCWVEAFYLPATRRKRRLPYGGCALFSCPATPPAQSTVQLSADHVHAAEGGDEVGDHLAFDHAVEGRHRWQTRGAAAHAVGTVAAVGDDVEAELAVGALGGEVGFAGGRPDAVAFHHEHEVVHQPLDGAVRAFL